MDSYFYLLLIPCLIVAVKGRYGAVLALIVATMLLWPEFVRVKVVVMQLSLTRILEIAIILRFIIEGGRLKNNYLDYCVIGLWVYQIFASIMAGSESKYLIYMVGRLLDTVLIFYAARICIRSSKDLGVFLKYLIVIIVIMSVLAFVESITQKSLYTYARELNQWAWSIRVHELRMGLARAYGATLNPIYYGLSAYMGLALYYTVETNLRRKIVYVIGFIGVFMCMSSGPIITMFMLIFLALFVKDLKRFKVVILAVFIAALFAEFASNRHFYNLIEYVTFNSQTAWYRSRLLEVAFLNSNEFIWYGVGDTWPNHWGAQIDGRAIVDVVNQYLIVALRGGIIGLILFLVINVGIVLKSFELGRKEKGYLRIAWVVISLNFGGLTVGYFNPVENLIYLYFGIAAQVLYSGVKIYGKKERKVVNA